MMMTLKPEKSENGTVDCGWNYFSCTQRRRNSLEQSPLILDILDILVLDPGGGGVLPYMGYIGMCGPKGYGFSAVLVINRISILADFGHFGHK